MAKYSTRRFHTLSFHCAASSLYGMFFSALPPVSGDGALVSLSCASRAPTVPEDRAWDGVEREAGVSGPRCLGCKNHSASCGVEEPRGVLNTLLLLVE